jgi:ribosomal peptide maturation radical SAM protein 1
MQKNNSNSKILLICMPFQRLNAPAFGISLIKSIVRKTGLNINVRYLNLAFAEFIGFDTYESILDDCPNSWQTGEWIFSEALFGDQACGINGYINALPDPTRNKEEFAAAFQELPKNADKFLTKVFNDISWEDYDIIGFSVLHQQLTPSLSLAKLVKEQHSDKIIIFGGKSCEGKMGIAIHKAFEFVDFVCSGEGDINFPILLQYLMENAPPIPEIPGIIQRRANNTTEVPQQIVWLTADLNALPSPDRSDYFEQLRSYDFHSKTEPRFWLEGARGCWWGEKHHCTFCGLNGLGMTFRTKSITKLLDEIKLATETYKCNRIGFIENIISMDHLRRLIPLIKDQWPNLDLWYEVKANLSKAQVKALGGSGVKNFQPGIESFSNNILSLMDKGCTFIQNVAVLKWAEEFDMRPYYNLLTGFPGEKPEDYDEMFQIIPLLTHLPEPSSIARFRLERFSVYFEHSEQYPIINIRPKEIYSAIFPIDPELLFDLALFFDFDYASGWQPENNYLSWFEAVNRWKHPESVGALIAAKHKGKLHLLDQRGPIDEVAILAGIEGLIYDYCDEIHSYQAISRKFSLSKGDLTTILEGFVSEGLMIRDNNRYLSLAVRVDHRLELVNSNRFPDNLFHIAEQMNSKMKHEREQHSRQLFKTTWAR